LLLGLGAFTVLLALGVVAFARLQQRQLFSRILGSVQWLGLQLTSAHQSAVRGLDENLREHYRNGRGRLVLSLLTQLVGFGLGALEVALACHFLGEPITTEQALFTEVFGLGLATAFFLVPGGLGVSEGGRAAAFALLGLDPVTGFAVGIVRRLRDLAWAGGGLALYALRARRGGHRR
ncbi:flippase-like domain-containing protein, partial [bacterium]|nr:flippase-like domain-containing protein [bacterium]